MESPNTVEERPLTAHDIPAAAAAAVSANAGPTTARCDLPKQTTSVTES